MAVASVENEGGIAVCNEAAGRSGSSSSAGAGAAGMDSPVAAASATSVAGIGTAPDRLYVGSDVGMIMVGGRPRRAVRC